MKTGTLIKKVDTKLQKTLKCHESWITKSSINIWHLTGSHRQKFIDAKVKLPKGVEVTDRGGQITIHVRIK